MLLLLDPLPLEPELDRAAKVLEVFLVVAHDFAGRVGKFRDRPAVYILQLDDDV